MSFASDLLVATSSQTRLWASGMTVQQWGLVISPLDGEVYRRKTATGGGTTDPADDTTNYFAVSFVRPGSIVNRWTASSTPHTMSYSEGDTINSQLTLSAGTRTQVLSLSGKGVIRGLGLLQSQSQTRNVRLELIVDGRTIFDVTSAFVATGTSQNVFAVGNPVYDPASASPTIFAFSKGQVEFARSVAVWVTSSVLTSGLNLSLRSLYEVRT